MKAHPQRPTVFVTRLFFPIEKLETVVDSVEKWFETSGQDESASWGCYRFPPERNVRIYLHPEEADVDISVVADLDDNLRLQWVSGGRAEERSSTV